MPNTPPTRRLRVTVTNTTKPAFQARGLAAWLEAVAPVRARGEVSVAFVADAQMRRLNRVYRGKNVPTDVLSFPADPSHRPIEGVLGEIVIAAGVAGRQAVDAGHGRSTEARVLALHGLLHLLGHDHETDAGQMARLETRLRRRGGLREGLIARAQTALG